MGLKAAVQALKKAEELKAKVSRHNDFLNNSEVWSDQQQLQAVYHQVLVLDLEYALDKKVEQELWTLGFKNHIAALQHLSRDKKNTRRSECQALLSWCLEAASGFYLTLLQELCTAFELDLPFRRRGAVYGQTKPFSNSDQLTQPHKSSCLYICQYCLVHLGDIARYRSQRKQAESFYRHAILLSPSSGQPYNQLALLEASRGDTLATVFHYVRSISVKHPFPAAATNLSNTFSALIDNDDCLLEIHSKLSLSEFISLFLRIHGLLHIATNLDQAEVYVKSLNATFTALVATQAFSAVKLIQMTVINLYALSHTIDSFNTPGNSQLTEDEVRVKYLVLDLLAGAFSAYLLPIYTMNQDLSLIDYYALPAIKLTLDWIKTDPRVLMEPVFTKRLQIWPSLCKLLNSLQSIEGYNENKNCDKIPLPEDRDVQCFLPLVNAFRDLDFTCETLEQDYDFLNTLRITRLINLGFWLSTQTVDNNVLITARKMKNRQITFEPSNKQPDPTTELLEELKHFNIKEPIISVKEVKKSPAKEKLRSGILKPQGSLEKAREEREREAQLLATSEGDNNSTASLSTSSVSSTRSDTKLKRNRQNVAMQALVKKVEENNKQVTFVTEPQVKKEKPPPVPLPQTKNEILPLKTENLLPIEPIRMPRQIIPPPPLMNSTTNELQNIQQNPNSIPLPYPQTQNFTRNLSQFPVNFQNNSTNLSFMNSLTPQSNNISYPRQSFNSSTQLGQNQSFNVPFDVGNPSQKPPQAVGYQPIQTKDQFSQYSPWIRDDKLPMPPSTWWTNNQKPRNFTSGQSDVFNSSTNYSFNLNNSSNNVGFLGDNIGFERQFNPTGIYNNMSVWNTNSLQPNLHQLLINQPPPTSQTFGEVNKIQNLPSRDNHTMNMCETNETKTNSPVPGYSLFNSNWAPNLLKGNTSTSERSVGLMRQQSLFSGPGPSPLERLLEQQKQLRGTNKEET